MIWFLFSSLELVKKKEQNKSLEKLSTDQQFACFCAFVKKIFTSGTLFYRQINHWNIAFAIFIIFFTSCFAIFWKDFNSMVKSLFRSNSSWLIVIWIEICSTFLITPWKMTRNHKTAVNSITLNRIWRKIDNFFIVSENKAKNMTKYENQRRKTAA